MCVQLWNLLNSHLASVNRYLGIWLEAFEGKLPFPFFVISFGLNHNGSQLRCCDLCVDKCGYAKFQHPFSVICS